MSSSSSTTTSSASVTKQDQEQDQEQKPTVMLYFKGSKMLGDNKVEQELIEKLKTMFSSSLVNQLNQFCSECDNTSNVGDSDTKTEVGKETVKPSMPFYGTRAFYNQSDVAMIVAFRSCSSETRKAALAYKSNYPIDHPFYIHGTVIAALVRINAIKVLQYMSLPITQGGWGLDVSDLSAEPNLLIMAVRQHSNDVANWLMGLGVDLFLPTMLVSASTCGERYSEFVDAFMVACSYGNVDFAMSVLNKFSVNQLLNETRYGKNYISAAYVASRCRSVELIMAMEKMGVDFSTICDRDGEYTISWAAYNGHNKVLDYLIKRYKYDLNVPLGRKKLLLLEEAFGGDQLTTFALLLQLGADVTASRKDGQPLLLHLINIDAIDYVALVLVFRPGLLNSKVSELGRGDRWYPHCTVAYKIHSQMNGLQRVMECIEDVKKRALPGVSEFLALESQEEKQE